MYILSESSKYKSLNNKQDIIKLIREYVIVKNKDITKYTYKILSKYSKKELFCIYAKISFIPGGNNAI
jgi:hypothetical protein